MTIQAQQFIIKAFFVFSAELFQFCQTGDLVKLKKKAAVSTNNR